MDDVSMSGILPLNIIILIHIWIQPIRNIEPTHHLFNYKLDIEWK